MNGLKEETEERSKEERQEKQQQQRSRASMIGGPHGAWKMGIVYDAAWQMGLSPLVANKWVDYMDEVGWTQTDDVQITERHFRRSLRMFGRMEQKIAEREARRLARMNGKRRDGSPDYEAIDARKRAIDAKRREEASKADGAWDLCAERCANCMGGKHCPFFATPPQLREWPLAPEQCSKFKPLEAKGE